MTNTLTLEEIRAVLERIDLPLDCAGDDHTGISRNLRSAFIKLQDMAEGNDGPLTIDHVLVRSRFKAMLETLLIRAQDKHAAVIMQNIHAAMSPYYSRKKGEDETSTATQALVDAFEEFMDRYAPTLPESKADTRRYLVMFNDYTGLPRAYGAAPSKDEAVNIARQQLAAYCAKNVGIEPMLADPNNFTMRVERCN